MTINSLGQAVATWTPTIPAGGSAIIPNFATVQGNNKQAKNTMTNLVSLPSNSLHCLTAPQLLDQNEDFASVRARPGWPELVARARRGGGRATPVRAGRHYGPR